MDGRKWWAVALTCSLMSFLICCGLIYEGKSWGGDYSQYFAQARAIVTGTIDEWYDKNIFIIDNSCVLGSDVYPWMWAILIAPFYAVFGDFPIMLLKVYSGLFVTLGVFMFVLFLQRRMRLSRAALITGFIMFSFVYCNDVNAIQSDLVSFCMAMITLNVIDLYNRNRSGHSIAYAILAGVMICASVMTKTLCLGLLLALLAYDIVLVVQRLLVCTGKESFVKSFGAHIEWNARLWIRILPYVAYEVCTLLGNYFLLPSGGSYTDYFTFTTAHFHYSIGMYYGIFQSFFGSDVGDIISAILSICAVMLVVLTVLGIVLKWKDELYYAFYVPGMMLMLLFYDYYRTDFVLTFHPLMLLFSFYALEWLTSRLPAIRRYAQALVLAALVLVAAQSAVGIYCVQIKGYALNESMNEDTLDAFAYIDENVDDDDVVYFFKPRVLYLATNVYAYYQDQDDPADLELADYVLMSVYDSQSNCQEALDESGDYRIVYENDRFTLYQRISG